MRAWIRSLTLLKALCVLDRLRTSWSSWPSLSLDGLLFAMHSVNDLAVDAAVFDMMKDSPLVSHSHTARSTDANLARGFMLTALWRDRAVGYVGAAIGDRRETLSDD